MNSPKELTELQSLVWRSSNLHLIVWREVAARSDIHAAKGIADERVYKNMMVKRGREEAFKLLDQELEDKYKGEPVIIGTKGEFEEEKAHGREIVYRFQICIERLARRSSCSRRKMAKNKQNKQNKQNKPSLKPWRYAGSRNPYSTPQGRPIKAYVVSVSTPGAGIQTEARAEELLAPWEAIFCKRKADAKYIEEMAGKYEQLLAFAKEFLERVPECTCAEYYKPYYPRRDPQCQLCSYFDFDEDEIEEVRKLVEEK